MLTDRRLEKIERVARNRQSDLTIVLNNVHDPHNIGAVLRTCDSVGISEIFVILNDGFTTENSIVLGKKAASSARKWVDVYLYQDVEKCMKDIKSKYKTIAGTHLGTDSVSCYDVDFTQSLALVFGNEHAGISDEVLPYLDTNILIPQMGMVESLNISVSVAITLYEAYRQRKTNRQYDKIADADFYNNIKSSYLERNKDKYFGSTMIKVE
ncbi:MAG: RNA methyltransferase [Saprospiraceae bacterium]